MKFKDAEFHIYSGPATQEGILQMTNKIQAILSILTKEQQINTNISHTMNDNIYTVLIYVKPIKINE